MCPVASRKHLLRFPKNSMRAMLRLQGETLCNTRARNEYLVKISFTGSTRLHPTTPTCTPLQHTATHCNTYTSALHSVLQCATASRRSRGRRNRRNAFLHVCCRVLQCVAVCGSVLQCATASRQSLCDNTVCASIDVTTLVPSGVSIFV